MEFVDPIVFRLTIFVLAIFVGYFVVWAVTPALHTPLMSVTNAISSVIIVGALIAVSVPLDDTLYLTRQQAELIEKSGTPVPPSKSPLPAVGMSSAPDPNALYAGFQKASSGAYASKAFGFFALILASVNIFGGFLVTARMLAMYKKKAKK